MTNKHSIFKKATSLLLSVLLIAGVLSVAVPFIANAAAYRSASLPMGNTDIDPSNEGTEWWGSLKFIVPEAIYLYPNGSSWNTSTSSPFQYYINNDSSGNPIAAAGSTGKIYFEYAYEFDHASYGASSARISYQFVNSSLTGISGGSVTLSSSQIASGGSVDITAGSSPLLQAGEKGCYILWTLSFTDTADGESRCAYALTYVYKPYVVPVGGMARTQMKFAVYSYAQQITWLSGVHSIVQQSGGRGLYYPNYSGDYGLSGFITKGNAAYVGGENCTPAVSSSQNSTWTVSYPGATRDKFAFIGTSTSIAHFDDTSGHNDSSATSWGSGSSNGSTFNVASFDYTNQSSGATKRNAVAAVYSAPYGVITIDSSRYTDLSQIPNLSIALMATDNEESDKGNWYIGDYTATSTFTPRLAFGAEYRSDDSSERSEYFNDRGYIIAGQGAEGGWDSWGEDYDGEGVKYAGAWPRTILGVNANPDPGVSSTYVSTYDYGFKGSFSTNDSSDYCFTHVSVRLNARQLNKSTLRSAVARAISLMPGLGVNGMSNGFITSRYFDANSQYKWTALQTAFRNALIGLTTLESSQNPNDLAKALNNAIDGLCTKVEVDRNGGSFESLTEEEYINRGAAQDHRYTPTYSGPNKPYYNFRGWSGNPDTHSGLSYVNVGYNNKVYATWEPKQYTITLKKADDDIVNEDNVIVPYNVESTGTMSDIIEAAGHSGFPAARQGWGLHHWVVLSTGEESNWTVGEEIDTLAQINERHGNVTLKAVWEEGLVDVTVNYYNMDPSGSYPVATHPTSIQATSGYTNQIIRIDPDAPDGFRIDNQKSRLVGTVAANGSLVLKVYFARTKVTAKFNNYDGTELQAQREYNYGAVPTYTGVTPVRPTENGIAYTFYGWTDGSRTFAANELLPITENTVYTAVFSETELYYNVTSQAGDGAEIQLEEGAYPYGATVQASASALPGYVDDGLKLYVNGEEQTNPCTFTVTGNTVVSTNALEFLPRYTVEFYSADEEHLFNVTVVEGGDASAAPEYTDAPEREGYTFAQWSLPLNNVTENMKVIAQYNKDGAVNYSINFYNDAKLLAALVRESGEEFDYPEDVLGLPEKTGFDFTGWNPANFSPAAGDLNVYAQFVANGYVEPHTLSVDYGHDGLTASFTGEPGTTATVNYPVREGYAFTGWTGDTAGLNGETYFFQEQDAHITATWYDLTQINTAAETVQGFIDSGDYHYNFVLRCRSLLTQKTNLTGAVPASASDLDGLLGDLNQAITDAPDWYLYSLNVIVDGGVLKTVRDISGATYTLPDAEKEGYRLSGWNVEAGSVAENEGVFTYTFTNSGDNATAVFTFDVSQLQSAIDALSDDVYCHYYINNLNSQLDAIRSAIDNNEDIDDLVEAITEYLAEKAQHKHKYTVLSDEPSANPATCTLAGTAIYVCENCADKSTLKDAPALGHEWGEWAVTREATLDEDGELSRECSRCHETETRALSLYDDSDKAVKFVPLNGVSYTVYPSGSGEGTKIKSLTLFKWFSDKELKFKVNVSSDFAFPDYVVFIDGEQAQPGADGYYTVPAEAALSTVTVSGVVVDDFSGQGSSFWDWLMNLLRMIANFFRNIFK